MELKISIVTCSDTRDLAQDEAGAALEELIEAQGWTVASHVVVRDDVSEIGDAVVEAADEVAEYEGKDHVGGDQGGVS